MNSELNSIWLDWRTKVPNGVPNPSNDYHLVLLKELCLKRGIDSKIVDDVILVLEKDDDKYQSVGYGKYKLKKDIGPDGKGKEGTPTFEKDDSGNYVETGKEDGEKKDDGEEEKEEPKASGMSTDDYAASALRSEPDADDVDVEDGEGKDDKGEEEQKDKSLRKNATPVDDFNKNDSFTKTGVSDFPNENVKLNSDKQFGFSKSESKKFFGPPPPTKFPRRYIKALERLMSLDSSGKSSITDVLKGVGAGELNAQSGEILTMMGATIKDDTVAKEFFDKLRTHAKLANKPVLDKTWIDSAEKVRQGMFARYDSTYGEGEWELESAGWDVKEEVESLGMKDYKKDKGFSTDAYFVVNGELDEVSLKKDLKANLLNATTGRVIDLVIFGNASEEEQEEWLRLQELRGPRGKKLPPEDQQKFDEIYNKYAKDRFGFNKLLDVERVKTRQKKKHAGSLGNPDFKKEVSSASSKLSDDDKKEIAVKMGRTYKDQQSILSIIDKVPDLMKDLEHPITLDSLKATMKKNGMKTTTRNILKTSMIMQRMIVKNNPNHSIAGSLDDIVKNSRQHSANVAKSLLTNESMKKGLLRSIRESLPLKSLLTGEENMSLGNISADEETLSTIFGTPNFDEVNQNLKVVDDAIVYQVEGTGDYINVANMVNRPDGIGYGETWKLEFALHKDFAALLTQTNQELGRI